MLMMVFYTLLTASTAFIGKFLSNENSKVLFLNFFHNDKVLSHH